MWDFSFSTQEAIESIIYNKKTDAKKSICFFITQSKRSYPFICLYVVFGKRAAVVSSRRRTGVE